MKTPARSPCAQQPECGENASSAPSQGSPCSRSRSRSRPHARSPKSALQSPQHEWALRRRAAQRPRARRRPLPHCPAHAAQRRRTPRPPRTPVLTTSASTENCWALRVACNGLATWQAPSRRSSRPRVAGKTSTTGRSQSCRFRPLGGQAAQSGDRSPVLGSEREPGTGRARCRPGPEEAADERRAPPRVQTEGLPKPK